MITPAISVLSAVEGLKIVEPRFAPLVLPVSVVILVGLFIIQSRGTAIIGRFFGPIMLVYFLVLAGLGLMNILDRPDVLLALNPIWAVRFFQVDFQLGFLA
jgi:KUP system potassium uptake protein